MLYEAGLPKNRCYFVMPKNLELATKLVSDQRIDFFSFIGSSKVGWFLRSKLAPGTRCSLEHGGMAPTFITSNSDIESCAKSIARGGFYHAGQVCVSVQRVYLDKKVSSVFFEKFIKEVETVKIGNPMNKETVVGPLIRKGEVSRVDEWVKESLKNGSKLMIMSPHRAKEKKLLIN